MEYKVANWYSLIWNITGVFMLRKVMWLIIAFITVLIFISLFFHGYAAIEMNNEIDLCSDQTSGKYIWDDDLRAKTCLQLNSK
jgi:hypothetical protein